MKNLLDIAPFDYTKFIGLELGNVTILKKLGHGNRGVVFIAFQKSLKRQVAVKILPKVSSITEELLRQFRDEAEIIAVLSHPNIIPIFEIGESDDFYFQVMQLITGSDLNKIISKHLKHPVSTKIVLPIEQTIDIVIQVLDGLGYAHDEGIVHQDIKPGNILIEERTKRPLIADFGIAKTVQMDPRIYKNIIIGTPVYLSPEQAAAKETDKRTDIYSTGVLLFKMLTGTLPIREENSEEILFRKIKKPDTFFTLSPSETTSFINNDLEKIILKAIESDVENRYQDCYSFKDELIYFSKKHLAT